MKKAYIWGTGKQSECVYNSVRKEECKVCGFIDNNSQKWGTVWKNGEKIYNPNQIAEYDYIIISAQNSSSILKQCEQIGIPQEQIIDYWNQNLDFSFIDSNFKRIFLLERELEKYKCRLENLPYELGVRETPIVKSSEELLMEVISKKKSLCRFGDGEFEMIRGNERPWFQKTDPKLANRLREILNSDDENILVAIADNFGNLDKYTDSAADDIRKYIYGDTRKEIIELIGTTKIYWDTYVSRPYIIYRNKKHADTIFKLFKKVWRNRSVLIVEGKYARIGVNNDLLDGCKNVQRVICPPENAFGKYDEILETIKEHVLKETIVLISLGPTATVLAFDLAKQGIQALDIGQIDTEYEWFLQGAEVRVEIKGKSVAELSWCHSAEKLEDKEYIGQIVAEID